MDTLRTSQHNFLKVAKDRSFLLDRLLQYEKPDISSSESDDTDTSEEDEVQAPPTAMPLAKKKKLEPVSIPQNIPTNTTPVTSSYRQTTLTTPAALVKKKQQQRIVQKKTPVQVQPQQPTYQRIIGHSIASRATIESTSNVSNKGTVPQNIMTTEEVERHLQSRQSLAELQLRAPPTVPTEMFSNEPSLDSEGGNDDCLGDMGLMQD